MRTPTLFLLCACALRAGDATLAVLDFQSRGVSDHAALRELWERTREAAVSLGAREAAPGEEARRRLSLLGPLPASCDESCLRRTASQLGADRLLVPSVDRTPARMRLSFALVDGSTGRRIRESGAWSDGRVDRAVAAGVSQVLGGKTDSDIGPSRALWTSLGLGAAGIGAVLFLGLGQDRSPSSPPRPPDPAPAGGTI